MHPSIRLWWALSDWLLQLWPSQIYAYLFPYVSLMSRERKTPVLPVYFSLRMKAL
jgi:hypothetical protein